MRFVKFEGFSHSWAVACIGDMKLPHGGKNEVNSSGHSCNLLC